MGVLEGGLLPVNSGLVGVGGEEDGLRTMSAKEGWVWKGLKDCICGGGAGLLLVGEGLRRVMVCHSPSVAILSPPHSDRSKYFSFVKCNMVF